VVGFSLPSKLLMLVATTGVANARDDRIKQQSNSALSQREA